MKTKIVKRKFSWLMLLVVTFCLGGCGTFQLAGGISAPSGKTADQQQNDILFCKDQAQMEANSAGQQTKDFLMGLTIVGAPIAIEQDKSLQREVFAKCMTAKGYTITPVQTAKVEPAKATGTDIQQTAAAQLEQLRELRDRGLITSEEYDQKRKKILENLGSIH